MSSPARRVLIVDDHAGFRESARELLEHRGFIVAGEADGARAGLDAVATVAPDAVLLDVHLPDGNGMEVCRAITGANPALAVLLVSADGVDVARASDCGAVGFVPKARLAAVDLDDLLGGDDGGEADVAARMTA